MKVRGIVTAAIGCVSFGVALTLCGCSGRRDSWSQSDRTALESAAAAIADRAGGYSAQAFDGGAGITAASSYAIVKVAGGPSGTGPDVDQFWRNLARLGFPKGSDDCDHYAQAPTLAYCTGPYGDVTVRADSIELSAYKAFFLDAARAAADSGNSAQ